HTRSAMTNSALMGSLPVGDVCYPARATSSPPTPPGGSGRPSPGRWPTRPGPSESRRIVEAVSKLARARRQMLHDLSRELTSGGLDAELDITPEKVIEVQKYGREPISLDTPLGEDGDSEFGDLIEDSETIQPGEAVSFTRCRSSCTRSSAPCPNGRPAWCP